MTASREYGTPEECGGCGTKRRGVLRRQRDCEDRKDRPPDIKKGEETTETLHRQGDRTQEEWGTGRGSTTAVTGGAELSGGYDWRAQRDTSGSSGDLDSE